MICHIKEGKEIHYLNMCDIHLILIENFLVYFEILTRTYTFRFRLFYIENFVVNVHLLYTVQ